MDQNFLRERPPEVRITRQQLIEKMVADKRGSARAAFLLLDDVTSVFFDKNPDWPNKARYEELIKKVNRDAAEEFEITELLRGMGFEPASLRASIQITYANQNGYSIVQEG